MRWNHWIRQLHRWLSVAFTLAAIVTAVALAQGQAAAWVNYLPLPPLFLLWITGLYLLLLPHVVKWRSRRRTA